MLEEIVNAAIDNVCDLLEAFPGRREVVEAAHNLQAFVFTNVLSQDPELFDRRPLGWADHMIELALSIIAADVASLWPDRKWWTRSGILLAFSGTRMAEPDGYPAVLGWVSRSRPRMLRGLAEAIATHATFLAKHDVAPTSIDAFQHRLIGIAFRELVHMSTKSSPGLRRHLASTPAADIYTALARHDLRERYTTCQHSLHSALVIASSPMPDDRIISLIEGGVLEMFVRAHVAGNAQPSGPLCAAAFSQSPVVASPLAGCAVSIAKIARRRAIRPIVQARLGPLLGPMLLSLDRIARSHDYGAWPARDLC